MFYKDEKLALMIDGPNFHSATRALDMDIDYKALHDEFMRRGRLVRAFYFTTLIEEGDYAPLRPLIDWLSYNGYMTQTKQARDFTDSMGRRRVKGDMDVEMTIAALEVAPVIDHLVLFSGNGDLKAMVEAVQKKGVRVSVVSTLKAASNPLSDELRRQADHFIELEDLRSVIMRKEREKVA
jgi:uncharacterized LabA/DUF88 family protein